MTKNGPQAVTSISPRPPAQVNRGFFVISACGVVASRLLLTALVFLGPGMAGDLFVVIAKGTQSPGMAGAIAGFLLLVFYGLWFGVSAWRRK